MLTVVSFVTSGLLIFVLGLLTDLIPAYITIPTAFFSRFSFLIIIIFFIDNVESYWLIALTMFMIVATSFENTTLDGLFIKNHRKEIRGSLNGAYNFFSNVGQFFFAGCGGFFYDSFGTKSPFAVVAFFDITFAVICVIMRLLRKFNQ